MEIQAYTPAFFEQVRAMCIDFSPVRKHSEVQRLVAAKTYCDYYLECEPEHAMVVLEDGKLIGYALCAATYGDYRRRFFERYIPIIKKFGRFQAFTCQNVAALHKPYAGYYPTHCFLAISEDYPQKEEAYQLLIEAVCSYWEAQESRGICMMPSPRNKALLQLLQKNGFEVLHKGASMWAMGKVLF